MQRRQTKKKHPNAEHIQMKSILLGKKAFEFISAKTANEPVYTQIILLP